MDQNIHHRIWRAVSLIPAGKVASYGQIARICGGCTARMVGNAMAALPDGSMVPWQRVVNSKGKISLRSYGFGGVMQKILLEEEGVVFDENGSIDFNLFGWNGPGE